ncbi:MAG: phage/plasmid replication protein [Phocaeicola sp.]|nr:phage/plasmid replication protein [Phocaeicola sp.]
MYDKLKIWAARSRATPDIGKFLDNAKDQIDHATGEIRTFGSLDGLKVSVFTGGISIIGSLSKYLYSNNIYPLDRHSTAEAVEKLSDNLHLNISDAKITGLEFGTQFVMRHKPEDYIRKLGEMPRLQRYHFEVGTLYYKPRGKQQPKVFVFYDKKADAVAKGMTLPDGLSDANLLKYEMRFNQRLPQQLGVPEVTALTLSDKEFYRQMVRRYQDCYFSISKQNQVKTNIMNEIKTVSDAYDVLVARLINQSDQTLITAYLEELKEAKTFEDRKSYTRLKKKIQDVAAKAELGSDELVKELDNEIKNVGAYV